MKNLAIFFSFLASLFITGCQGSLDSYSTDEIEYIKNYPFKIYPKTSEELSFLQAEFDSLNEYKVCTSLNPFGYTDDAHCQENPGEENIVDQKRIISIVKATLVKNSKFTNVPDTLTLQVKKFDQIGGSYFLYTISFEQQVLESIPVIKSNILVFFFEDHVYQIRGSWYPDIPIIPEDCGYTVAVLQNKILGEKIEYFCQAPVEFTITRSSILSEYTEKCILPVIRDDFIEFRFVYRFTVCRNYRSNSNFNVYVDIVTGKIIEIEQLFRCS